MTGYQSKKAAAEAKLNITPTKDEALRLALEALEEAWYHVGTFQPTEKAIDLYDEARTAIKEALAQPVQEPVAWFGFNEQGECREVFTQKMRKMFPDYPTQGMTPVYISPPQRKPLSDEEIVGIVQITCIGISPQDDTVNFARAIEAAHGIKGEA